MYDSMPYSLKHMLDSLDPISYEAIDLAYQDIVKIEREHDNTVRGWLADSTMTVDTCIKLCNSTVKHDLKRKRLLFRLIYSICKKNNLSFYITLACMAHKHRWKVDSARYIHRL